MHESKINEYEYEKVGVAEKSKSSIFNIHPKEWNRHRFKSMQAKKPQFLVIYHLTRD